MVYQYLGIKYLFHQPYIQPVAIPHQHQRLLRAWVYIHIFLYDTYKYLIIVIFSTVVSIYEHVVATEIAAIFTSTGTTPSLDVVITEAQPINSIYRSTTTSESDTNNPSDITTPNRSQVNSARKKNTLGVLDMDDPMFYILLVLMALILCVVVVGVLCLTKRKKPQIAYTIKNNVRRESNTPNVSGQYNIAHSRSSSIAITEHNIHKDFADIKNGRYGIHLGDDALAVVTTEAHGRQRTNSKSKSQQISKTPSTINIMAYSPNRQFIAELGIPTNVQSSPSQHDKPSPSQSLSGYNMFSTLHKVLFFFF